MLRIALSLRHCPRVFHSNGRCAASIQCGTRALSTSTYDSEKVSRRISVLSRLINRLRLPAASSIDVGGATIELPAEHVRVEDVDYTPEEIQYLGGFFDSSGHIHRERKGNKLEITQTSSRPEALLLFRRILGGRLSYHCRGHGLSKPCIKWTLSGQPEVSRAASILREASREKRSDFAELAAQVGDSEKNKAKARRSAAPTTWAYFAGVFDSGGCIHIRSRGPYLVISMSRKDPEILMELQYMMRREYPEWVLEEPRDKNPYYTLHIREDEAARGVLSKLLENKLLVRRAAAEFALTTDKENHHHNREEFNKFTGDQSRYRRLTQNGVERAVKITSVGRIVKRLKKKEAPEWVAENQKLQELKKQHNEQSAVERLALLRSDIRGLMRRGAAVE